MARKDTTHQYNKNNVMVHRNDSLVDVLKKYKHICWYMSAGADFRPLLFLSEAFYNGFSEHMETAYPAEEEKIIPDLFIFSDMNPPKAAWYANNEFEDIDTHIQKLVDENEWKYVKHLYLSPFWAHRKDVFEKRTSIKVEGYPIRLNDIQPRAFFMNAEIISWWYGTRRTWRIPLIYVIGENDDLYQTINGNASIESIIAIRPEIIACEQTGYKLARQMDDLRTRFLIAENIFVESCFAYKELAPRLYEFYRVNKFWSSRGPVGWWKWSDA